MVFQSYAIFPHLNVGDNVGFGLVKQGLSRADRKARIAEALEMVEQGDDLRARLQDNAKRFRAGMSAAGFDLLPGEHPIIPVMLGDAALSQEMASKLMQEGVYVIGFFYPVVPKGKARIRTQMSAAHTPEMIDRAVAAFTTVGKELGVI